MDDEKQRTLGDFRILREIGRGGMGVVYEAEQVSLRRKVALKLLHAHLSLSREAIERFLREAEAGARPDHPGIVSIYAAGEHQNTHYIAQELVEGGRTLGEDLEEYRKEKDLPLGYFRRVAEWIMEAAQGLSHAHASGVIHRDVKPSNILLTKTNRSKVTDFGLAKVEDALSLSRTGEYTGTPFYMSPEQAVSRRVKIDHRTDVYSLGVTLYEALTLERPFEGESSLEVLKKVVNLEPRDPRRVNPRIPRDLAVICLKAMEKEPGRRYRTMKEFGDDLFRFLQGEFISARPAGPYVRLRKRVKRHPVISAVSAVAAAALLAFVFVVPWVIAKTEREHATVLEEKRRNAVAAKEEADAAEKRAREQTRIAEDRYAEIIRLSDMKWLSELEEEARDLWPAHPERLSDLQAWVDKAEQVLGRLDIHRRTLSTLEARADLDTAMKWQQDTLAKMISGLGDLRTGLLNDVKHRLRFASTLRKKSIDDHCAAWDRAVASIADPEECPLYRGLRIEPQLGFIPIGQDPDSGLWEFLHLQTGDETVPERGQDGRLKISESTGLVFVLIPGGEFDMGAIPPDEDHPLGSPNVDPEAEPVSVPVHRVTLRPFLLSKYEMTQGQWNWFTDDNPSMYYEGPKIGGAVITFLHPVEQVSWEDCIEVLDRMKLRLPSESEWEYAARAGTTTVWWTGNEKESLRGVANLYDLTCKEYTDERDAFDEWLDDGHVIHAPVGCYDPNPFGLYDVYGNVLEWCQDAHSWDYLEAPTDGSAFTSWLEPHRISRGGSFTHPSRMCRSSFRFRSVLSTRIPCGGVRPVADLQ